MTHFLENINIKTNKVLETVILISIIISILLFLVKIKILPPNFVIRMNRVFWIFS